MPEPHHRLRPQTAKKLPELHRLRTQTVQKLSESHHLRAQTVQSLPEFHHLRPQIPQKRPGNPFPGTVPTKAAPANKGFAGHNQPATGH